MMDPVLNIVIQSSFMQSHENETHQIQTTNEQHILLIWSCLHCCPLFLLINIVKPVNNVEEGEDSWEDHPRPFVNRVYISQVWDVDL